MPRIMVAEIGTTPAHRARAFALAAALFALGATAPAQTALFRFRGEAETGFGETMATVGDVNGDGCPDFAISDVEDQRGEGAGRVRIYSGCTGVLLHEIVGGSPHARFGAAISPLGDIDYDGSADFVIASGSYLEPLGKVQAYSGRDGSELWTSLGNVGNVALARAGDIDGDGIPDLLVGCREGTNGEGAETGFVRVLSGADGHELLRVEGQSADDAFGSAVASVGDLDGDGVPDFAVGAPVRPDRRDVHHKGTVRVYSGKSGALLRDLLPNEPAIGLGTALGFLGTHDNKSELAAGTAPAQPVGGAGTILIFSLDSGRQIRRIDSPEHDQWFGNSLATTEDIDKDGKLDLIVGAFERVYVYGSAAWQPLREFSPMVPGARNRCFRVTSLGDLNGDGIPEIGVTTRANLTTSGAYTGAAQVLSTNLLGLASDTHEIRYWKGGGQRLFLRAGKQYAGRSYRLVGTLSGTTPGFQKGAVQVPLNLDRYLVSTLQVTEGSVFQGFGGELDENGEAVATLTLPPLGPQIKGLTAHHVFIVWDDHHQAFTSNAVPLSFVK